MRPEPAERLVFSHVVEGLIKNGLRGQLSPQHKERLRAEGLDVERPLLPAYPVAMWSRCLNHMVEDVFPDLSREEALRQLAARSVEGLGETLIGKAMFAMLRLIGPRRMVQRLPRDLAGSDNYTNASVEELGPNQFLLTMNSNVGLPGYAESLFASMLRISGAKNPTAEVSRKSENETVYLLRWE